MPIAALDIGSNSLRLLIGSVVGTQVVPVRYEHVTTRLASGIGDTGVLSEAAIESTIEALTQFAAMLRAEGVRHVKAVGTSAIREAANAGSFIARALGETGIKIEPVAGEEEARLTALGAFSALGRHPSALLLDIGGGSTEMTYLRDGVIIHSCSVPVGALKLIERHIHSDPPNAGELGALTDEADRAALLLKKQCGGFIAKDTVLVGTAGTMTTLAAMDLGLGSYDRDLIHGHEITIGRLGEMASWVNMVTLAERKKIRGLEPDRADLIIAGLNLTILILFRFGLSRVLISDSGLIEGVLIELSREVQP